jgi:lipopolysaccharide export system permease protein
LERWSETGRLEQRILAAKATWNPADSVWRLVNARIRDIDEDGQENLKYLTRLDTALSMRISDFGQRAAVVSTMSTPELSEHIAREAQRGAPVNLLKLEKHARTSSPFSIYVLTLIGVGIASRKLRGGMGYHLFLAVVIGFFFVFTSKIITVYAASMILPADAPISTDQWLLMAAWLPNVLFATLGGLIVWKAPK